MKNTGKFFVIAVLAAAILLMACNSNPSGTYSFTQVPAWTITFNAGSFTMFIPASVSPTGQNITASGAFTVSGKTMLLTGLDQPMSFTITDSKTLTESDGSVWKKQ